MHTLICFTLLLTATAAFADEPKLRLATFVADVTPPIGHPCSENLNPEAA